MRMTVELRMTVEPVHLGTVQKVEFKKEAGHIALIKFDGERKEEKVTVVLNYLKDGKSSVFQRHGDDLLTLLRKLLED